MSEKNTSCNRDSVVRVRFLPGSPGFTTYVGVISGVGDAGFWAVNEKGTCVFFEFCDEGKVWYRVV